MFTVIPTAMMMQVTNLLSQTSLKVTKLLLKATYKHSLSRAMLQVRKVHHRLRLLGERDVVVTARAAPEMSAASASIAWTRSSMEDRGQGRKLAY